MSLPSQRIFILDTGHSRLDLFVDAPEHACTPAWGDAFTRAGWPEVRRALRLASSVRWDLAVVNMREFCFLRPHACLPDGIWRLVRAMGKSPRQIGELLVFARLWRSGVPIALVNRSDRGGVWAGSDWFFRKCHACFLREMNPDPRWPILDLPETHPWSRRWAGTGPGTIQREDWAKLHPISLGLPDPGSYPAPGPKEIDVLYGHGQDFRDKPLRERLLGELGEACRTLGLRLKLVDRVPKAEWIRLMSGSHLVFSPPGVGWDCWRHYEAMMAGSVPLLTYPTILQYQPALDGENCFYFAPEPGGLTRCLKKAFSSPDRLPAMGLAGRKWVLEHHTFPRLRDYLIRKTLEASAHSRA